MSSSIEEDFQFIEAEPSSSNIEKLSKRSNAEDSLEADEIEAIIEEFFDNEIDDEDDIYHDADDRAFEARAGFTATIIEEYSHNNSESNLTKLNSENSECAEVKAVKTSNVADYVSKSYDATKLAASWGIWGAKNIIFADETYRSLKVVGSIAYTMSFPITAIMLATGGSLLTASLFTLAATSSVVCAAHYVPKLVGGAVSSISSIPVIGSSLKPAATIETSVKEAVIDKVGNNCFGGVYKLAKFAYNYTTGKDCANNAKIAAPIALAANTASQYVTENSLAAKFLNGVGRVAGKITDKGYEAIGNNIARSGDHLWACSKDVLNLASNKATTLANKLVVTNLDKVASQVPTTSRATVISSNRAEQLINTTLGSFALI